MVSIAEQFHSRGYRVTPHRLVILSILDGTKGHLSARRVFQLAQIRQPGITETTVYRTLDFLTHQGLALATQTGNGHLVYESAIHDHIHIECQHCGTTFELDAKILDRTIHAIESSTGFRINLNHPTFQGICPHCQRSLKGNK